MTRREAVASVTAEMGRPVKSLSFTEQTVNEVVVNILYSTHVYGDEKTSTRMTVWFDGQKVTGLYLGETR